MEHQKAAAVGRSFSLSWRSHPEVVEPMRFRSATTSGVPGVEKARNIVRQRATGKPHAIFILNVNDFLFYQNWNAFSLCTFLICLCEGPYAVPHITAPTWP